ncbi:MAG: hypothetical protein JWM56_1360 [Candidatus Peribacteria bacterium]|nr:hypothetical protein [Candidatus Peribacteria bacterium]
MKKEPAYEVDQSNIAYLEDRICINDQKAQIYGTQFHVVNEELVPWPIENMKDLNTRRKGMNLMETFEEHYRQFQEWFSENSYI